MDRGRIIESRKDNLIMAISGKPCCVLGTMVYLAPDDYQQGATVKIMFIHVPAAWLGMFAWGLMSAAALGPWSGGIRSPMWPPKRRRFVRCNASPVCDGRNRLTRRIRQ